MQLSWDTCRREPQRALCSRICFDAAVARIAEEEGFQYTRYTDDLTLSTTALGFTRGRASRVIGRIYTVMAGVGLSPNVTKTYVASPGARKVVLGLLVDGSADSSDR